MFYALSQIINTFLKNKNVSYSKFSKELKNDIEILVGQAVHKLRIKTLKMLRNDLNYSTT